ncbi:TMEM43 family protein [Patescibacteria group bacterium]
MANVPTGPVRYRKGQEGGFFSSLFGVLIGLALVVVGSPLAAWYSESQHRAEDFGTATQVEATSSETGYIVIEGDVSNVDALTCPQSGDAAAALLEELEEEGTEDATEEEAAEVAVSAEVADGNQVAEEDTKEEPKDCLYVSTEKEVYTRSETEVCGEPSDDQTIIRETVVECDEDGTNCDQCYLVEEYSWDSVESDDDYAKFTMGNYTVTPSGSANFIGSQELIDYEFEESMKDPIEDDVRYRYTYVTSDQRLLVAGDAENSEIKGAYEKKPFVISNKSYQGTMEQLQAQDSSMKWILRIVSLVLMIVGVIMIFGPLTYFTNIFKVIPVVGKHVDQGFDGVIKFFATVIGIVLWLVVWGIVLALKNIVVIIVVLAVIGVIIFALVMRGKKKVKGATSGPAEAEKK